MKVHLEHVEKKQGIIRKTTLYGVKLKIDFDPVETAIIKEHDLTKTIVLERGLPADAPDSAADLARDGIYDLTIYKLLKNAEDTYFFRTPAEAKEYEAALRDVLPSLKEHIMANESTGGLSDSFEL